MYPFSVIEPKWQEFWERDKTFRAVEDSAFPSEKRRYVLDMFPYPSSQGIHMGHPEGYTATDIYCRFLRAKGFNVLHPMGFDAFGLPAENYAIKTGRHPAVTTAENIERFRRQLKMLGFSYDWEREVDTSSPEYYRWTQWLFLQLYKKGLAYEAESPINWCPSCKTGLANEEVKDGLCERCGTKVTRKRIRQWMLKITAYAERLLADLDTLDWPEPVKLMQRNWIGKSEGSNVVFAVGSRESGIGNRESGIGNRESGIESREGGIGSREGGIGKREGGIGESGVGNRESGNGKQEAGGGRQEIGSRPQTSDSRLLTPDSYLQTPDSRLLTPDSYLQTPSSQSPTIEIYTTRPDTLFGATYMVLAPEHPLVGQITTPEQKAAVEAYIEEAAKKSDLERTDLAKTKTGVFTGAYAVNPVNEKRIPVWVADYVLISYGTGAIMAVPAHDERDWDFAKKYGLEIVMVVGSEQWAVDSRVSSEQWAVGSTRSSSDTNSNADGVLHSDISDKKLSTVHCSLPTDKKLPPTPYPLLPKPTTAPGISINSGQFSGLPTEEAKRAITAWLEERGLGHGAVNYKLRDWVFSRQRYWGEPIPLVHCPKCGIVPVPESELPLRLPEVETYAPSGTGESPLANVEGWVNTTCPHCGGSAKRETNTMPQWAGSCWYYLRYLDPKNTNAFASRAAVDYWLPVSLYVGGAEHAVLHLLYSRFWHKVFYDLGLVNTAEPFQRLINQGMILGEDNQKMSKSRGNVVNPDDIIRDYGADALRLYEMFMGPLEMSKPWMTAGLTGVSRFLERVWGIGNRESGIGKQESGIRNRESGISDREISTNADNTASTAIPASNFRLPTPDSRLQATDSLTKLLHKTIKKVTLDTETLNFNTAISAMMVYSAELAKLDAPPLELWRPFVIMLAAYAPHIGEELWEKCGGGAGGANGQYVSVSKQPWPQWDEALTADTEKTIVVQVNGKNRDKFTAQAGADKSFLEKTALASPAIQKWLEGKTPAKVIVVPDKLVNIVVK